MALISIDWRPAPRALRRFGVTVLIGFAVIATVCELALGNRTAALVCCAVGAGVGGLGVTGTALALPGYWLWMGVAFVLGNVVSRVIMALIFFGLVTPLGLLARLVRRDRLGLRPPTTSTWHALPDDHDVERQF